MPVRCPYCGEEIPTLEFAEHHKICSKKQKRSIDVEKLFNYIIKRERPEARYRRFIDVEVIDLPEDSKIHGSSLAFKCEADTCSAEGDLVIPTVGGLYPPTPPPEMEAIKEELKQIGCEVKQVHKHELLLPEAHIHFECRNLDEDAVRKLLNFARWF
jgi:hypothetical protein